MAEEQFTGIHVFGDSLSDNGNIPKLYGVTARPSPPYYPGRFSNGPAYAEYLPSLLNVPEARFTDDALGGALSGTTNLGNFPEAGTENEVERYLATGSRANSRDLFVLWTGANDYLGLSGAANPSIPLPVVQAVLTQVAATAVGNISLEVTQLASTGVKNFLVPNLPNLGVTPTLNGTPASADIGLFATTAHNADLTQSMAQLSRQLHVNIVVADVDALVSDVIAHPAKYGLTNVTQECVLNAACIAQKQPYLFWDEEHPTEQFHQIFARFFTASLQGPTVVGAQGEMAIVAANTLYDHITSRTQALRNGASGLSMSTGGGDGAAPNPDKPLSGFVTGSYGWGSRDDRYDAVGFSYDQTDVTGGLDYKLTPHLALGGLFGYGTITGDLHESLGQARQQSYQGALYATYFTDDFHFGAAVSYIGNDWDKLARNTFVANQTAQATTDGRTLGYEIDGGYTLHAGNFRFGPVVELRYAYVHIGAYTEHGAVGLNQTIDSQGINSLVGEIGLEAAVDTSIAGVALTPHLRLTYNDQFADGDRTITSRLVTQSAITIATQIDAAKHTWLRLNGGVDFPINDTFTALVDFDSSLARGDGSDQRAGAKLKIAF
ncbi:MAG TPA: autotransporter domain-containing protein [Aliidongia sp.]|uniref:autotransporter domain-containing protein n=1 Tax=Aliidongia sp. TaxID=1914230 RepID=UPI002DDD723B|nr:autotransporter domain-containing protein [Aliidongia sp.]HEV2675112.1 autotransporter domain-containing protein [Aliidongia sp.]